MVGSMVHGQGMPNAGLVLFMVPPIIGLISNRLDPPVLR
jgi:hypothetical protein